jgi:MFS transporter, ACS family, DAL5 transporter family protein
LLARGVSSTAHHDAKSFTDFSDAVNGSWLAVNGRSPADRSIRMASGTRLLSPLIEANETQAMFIMSANCSGIVGSQLFQAKDAPHYRTGWTAIVALISVAIALATFNVVQYWLSNKKLDARAVSSVQGNTEQVDEKKRYYI